MLVRRHRRCGGVVVRTGGESDGGDGEEKRREERDVGSPWDGFVESWKWLLGLMTRKKETGSREWWRVEELWRNVEGFMRRREAQGEKLMDQRDERDAEERGKALNEDVVEFLNKMKETEEKHEKRTKGRGGKWDPTPRISQKDVAAIRSIFGSETFFCTGLVPMGGYLLCQGNLRGEASVVTKTLRKRLQSRLGSKYYICLVENTNFGGGPVVLVAHSAVFSERFRIFDRLLWFVTWTAAAIRSVKNSSFCFSRPFLQDLVLPPVLGTVLFVNVAQMIVAARYGSIVAPRGLIPSFRTIAGWSSRVGRPLPNRNALFLVALSGAGLGVIIFGALLTTGVYLTSIFRLSGLVLTSEITKSWLVSELVTTTLGPTQLIDMTGKLASLHPLASIGASGLGICATSMLPLSFLEGGRMMRALFGRRTASLASSVTATLIVTSLSSGIHIGYVLPVFLALILAPNLRKDAPCEDEISEPPAWMYFVWYFLTFVSLMFILPVPNALFNATGRYKLLYWALSPTG